LSLTAAYIGFAARLAGHWSNGHFIAVVLHLGWTYIVGLLFVNLYFYIFNQQRFRADTATIPALQASPARKLQYNDTSSQLKL
jgi:nicotinamide riboside transporter PnuC